jgi:hypothetical protein
MYTTCLWCHQPLGRNAVVESFSVGRRLAFDAAKGRLWVVCRGCERWNLTPLQERWEAIEACERLYRDTRTRASTGEIGLAKVREGLELVRIGAPLLPEFAAWRYGDQFGRRFRRAAVITGLSLAALGGAAYGQFALGMSIMGLANLVNPARQIYLRRKRVAQLDGADGAPVSVTLHSAALVRADVSDATLRVAVPKAKNAMDTWSMDLADNREDVFAARARLASGARLAAKLDPRDFAFYDGENARRVLSILLPTINREGGSRGTVERGVQLLEQGPAGDARVEHVLRGRTTPHEILGRMDKVRRLALEIAVHEADERRWLEGELADLERRWREAETLAGIAERLIARPGAESAR